jgi:hypothetical protein
MFKAMALGLGLMLCAGSATAHATFFDNSPPAGLPMLCPGSTPTCEEQRDQREQRQMEWSRKYYEQPRSHRLLSGNGNNGLQQQIDDLNERVNRLEEGPR